MVETVQAASPAPLFDVTRIASLRKQLGHAATALKVTGFWSAIFVGFYLDSFGRAFAITVALLTPGCASLIAKRLRSGRTWAVGLAAVWFVAFAVEVLPKALRHFGDSPDVRALVGWIALLLPLYFLARGLIGFCTYAARRRQDRMPPDALALSPYEEGLRIKKRPKFINKKSIAAYWFLVLSPVPFLLMWFGQVLDPHYQLYSDWADQLGAWTGHALPLLVFVVLGTYIYRRARRAAMLPGSALMKNDMRPIVLYLRSFHDDSGIKLRARAANGRILPERLVKIPFEEVVTDHLWSYGAVLAIGDPRAKSKRASLGAARDYADDSSWHQKVTELIQQAAMIVVVAGGTEGLAWEIDTIARLGSLWKLVLLLPPVGVRELQARWQALVTHVSGNVLPAQIDFVRARAMIFLKGRAALIAGKKGNDWTYEAVLDEAALMIASERDTIHPTASSLQRVSRLRTVASDLASMATAALVTVILATAVGISFGFRNTLRPYASPGSERESFIAKMMQVCHENNPTLSAERLSKYCTCLASDLADAVTGTELEDSPRGAFEAKAKSVANTCSEKTLGQDNARSPPPAPAPEKTLAQDKARSPQPAPARPRKKKAR
jgi:hypothetical protein